MKKGTPQPISAVLQDVVEKLSRVKYNDLSQIIAAWPGAVGRKIARHTKPAGLKQGRLQVSVEDSAWFYQVSLAKEELLAKLKQKIGKAKAKVQEIQFRIGKI